MHARRNCFAKRGVEWGQVFVTFFRQALGGMEVERSRLRVPKFGMGTGDEYLGAIAIDRGAGLRPMRKARMGGGEQLAVLFRRARRTLLDQLPAPIVELNGKLAMIVSHVSP